MSERSLKLYIYASGVELIEKDGFFADLVARQQVKDE